MKIAVPNKGSLAESSISILKEAGYRQRSDSRDLILVDPENDVEFYYLRPRDIAIYVGNGELTAGITGRDLLIDSGANAEEVLALNFGSSTFRFAGSDQKNYSESDLSGKRIATAYPGLVNNYLARRQINADVVRLDGAVETSVRLGVADLIADVVSTGNTLRQAGLKIFGEPILRSEAILICRKGSIVSPSFEILKRRLGGVVIARQYVLVDYDITKSKLDDACAVTPGLESPTISPLAKADWVAVRAMVLRKDVNKVMDDLYNIGAKAIIVTEIMACRL